MTRAPSPSRRRRRLVLTGLLLLATVPVAAGALRLVELSGGAALIPEGPRAAGAPALLALHIVSASVFTVLGAFQFVPGTRGRRPRWHRTSGRVVAPAGVLAGVSGVWLTLLITEADGIALTAVRAAAGTAMAGSVLLALAAIGRRDIARHRAWMLRGYALGLGAGTQVLTLGIGLALVGGSGEPAEALLMAAGWLVNLAVAEWLIRRRPARPDPAAVPARSVRTPRPEAVRS